jgi:hypothetical protein
MGNTFAADLATMDLSLSDSIRIHLTSNHYPPVPSSMVQPCIDAIDAINDEEGETLIELPDGVFWRGETHAPAYAIAEAHHLHNWLNHSWDCDCYDCIPQE